VTGAVRGAIIANMNARQMRITEMLGLNRVVSAQKLAEEFGVSLMTVRRDLTSLEKHGLAVRTRGGAVLPARLPSSARSVSLGVVSKEKQAIGRVAATLVKPGDKVMIDSGSTSMQVALNLPNEAGITLVTTSLPVGQALFGSAIKVIVLGGELRTDIPCVYGPMTEQEAKRLRVDTIFVGCDGASPREGFFMSDLTAASLETEIVKIADKVVMVTESTKFRKASFVMYLPTREVDFLVTDPMLPDQVKAELEDCGVKVLIADPAILGTDPDSFGST
jgi:DeoR family transcriptional regulator, aga operon transcriptional repressor